MKIYIDINEWYPMYDLNDIDFGTQCTVPKRTYNKWRRIEREFWNMQREMEKIHEKYLALDN